MYRVGNLGWRFAAKVGIPLKLRVDIHFDAESQSFWANSPDLDGLVVSGQTLDEVRDEAMSAATELLDMQLTTPAKASAEMTFTQALPCAA